MKNTIANLIFIINLPLMATAFAFHLFIYVPIVIGFKASHAFIDKLTD